MDYLSEKEKTSVQKFLLDPVMREAVRKVLLSGIYSDGIMSPDKPADPLKNFILGTVTRQGNELLPDAEMGAKLRAIINGVSLVESGFKELEKLKPVESPLGNKVNRAR